MNLNNFKIFMKPVKFNKKNLYDKQLEYSKMAIELHQKRRFKSDQLSKLVQQNLSELNMHGTKFKIKINLTESEKGFVNYKDKILASTSKGIDEVEFYLSANKGEKIKPLSLIASEVNFTYYVSFKKNISD